MTVPASARHTDDPKSWTEHALTARDLRYAVALDHLEDLARSVYEVHEGNIGTHYETCYQYHAGCLAARFLHILKEES